MASDGTRRILLVDCDMFFVQVARLEDPEGAGRIPLLMVGGTPGGRGVVTSADYSLRAFGIRSGMPTAQALRLCPEATVVGVPRGAVRRRSREVEEALRALAPVVSAASIDEFYLDLTGTERALRGESLEEGARRIREAVLRQTGIQVSIGGGGSRLVAKMAARRAKPAGVFVVPAGGEGSFLREHRVADIPGVGPALGATLASRGIDRVETLLPWGERELVEWLGAARGRWLFARIRGIDPTPVSEAEPRRSVSAERTFSHDLTEDEALHAALVELAGQVGRGLRSAGVHARTITVKLRDADFRTRSASRTLAEPIEGDAAIRDAAAGLLRTLRSRRAVGVRLLGIGASSLQTEGPTPQLALFPGTAAPRATDLSHLTDRIKDRFGEGALVPAAILPSAPSPQRKRR